MSTDVIFLKTGKIAGINKVNAGDVTSNSPRIRHEIVLNVDVETGELTFNFKSESFCHDERLGSDESGFSWPCNENYSPEMEEG